ncbi:MAG: hypothetical protein EA392_04380, partial [Cryomorphaceae bacterium]
MLCGWFPAAAQLQVTPNPTALELIEEIVGPGVTVSNINLNCAPDAYGFFANGNTTNIGIGDGVLLTTGKATDAIGPNLVGNKSVQHPSAYHGDPDLQLLVSAPLFDACILEFDFVATQDLITVQYVFGSEEYPEYVCSQYNDVFAFFVSGPIPGGGTYQTQNVALIPNSTLPVAINTVNNGTSGQHGNASNCQSLSNSQYYIDNTGGLTIEYDGFTVALTAQVAIVPGAQYTFKFGIADAGDGLWDSGVFIKASSFSSFLCQSGTIGFEEGAPSPITFCANNGLDDVISAAPLGLTGGDNYQYFLTNSTGTILDINNTGLFNLNSYGLGSFFLQAISWSGTITGLEIGLPISGIAAVAGEGCFELSNALEAIRINCTEPPFILLCPDDEIVSCKDEITSNTSGLQFTVDCGTNAQATVSAGLPQLISGGQNCDGSVYRIVYTVIDLCGNAAQCQQLFTINNQGPVITTCPSSPVHITSGSQIAPTPGSVSYTTSCGLNATVVAQGPVISDNGCGSTTYTYNLVVTDECGRTAECEQEFILTPTSFDIACSNHPVSNVANHSASFAGVKYNYPSTGQSTWYYCVNGGINPSLNYTVFQMDASCNFNVEQMGTWSGNGTTLNPWANTTQPTTDAQSGVYGLKFDDPFANGQTRKYYFVLDNNYAISDILWVAQGGIVQNSGIIAGPSLGCNPASVTLSVTCPESPQTFECIGDVPAATPNDVVFEGGCGTVEVSIDETVSNGTGCPTDPIVVTRVYTISDDVSSITCETTINVFSAQMPQIAPVEDITLEGCNPVWPTVQTSWTGVCGAGGMITAVQGPLTVDGCIETLKFIFNVTDDCGNSASAFTYVSRIVDNENPVINTPANFMLDGCNADWPSLSTTWTDNCSAGGTITGIPGDVQENACTSTFTNNVCWSVPGLSHFTLALCEDITASDIQAVLINGIPYSNWTVGNDPTCGVYGLKWDDLQLGENTCADFTVVLNDAYLSTTSTGFLKAGPDCTSDEFTGPGCETIECVCIQSKTYTFIATDDCGNTSTTTTTVYRTFDEVPPIINAPEDFLLEGCNPEWPELSATWTDNCSDGGTVIATQGPITVDGCIETLKFFFNVTDECGNSASAFTFVSRIVDDVAPSIDAPADFALEGCNANWPELTANWSDNCS